ncbi:MAG: hypothetical protein ACO1NU_08745 [Arcticibacter sp.]
MAATEDKSIDTVDVAVSIDNAKVLGIDANGGTKLFPLSSIVRSEKNIATPATVPSGQRFAGETWPVSTAHLNVAYPGFGGITVTSKVGEQYTSNNRFVWNNGAWEWQRELVDSPELVDYTKKSEFSPVQEVTDGLKTALEAVVYTKGSIVNTSLPISGYVNSSGAIMAAQNWYSSYFVSVLPNKVYQYNGRIYGTIAVVAFFDENKVLIGSNAIGAAYNGVGSNVLKQTTFLTPAGTAYVRYSSNIPVGIVEGQSLLYFDEAPYFSSSKVNQITEATAKLVVVENTLAGKAAKPVVDNIVTKLGLKSFVLDDVINSELPFEGFINNTGTVSPAGNWFSSDFVSIPENRDLQFNGRIYGQIARFAYFNDAKGLLTTIAPGANYTGTGSDVLKQLLFKAPEGTSFIRYCSYKPVNVTETQRLLYKDPVPYIFSSELNRLNAEISALKEGESGIGPKPSIVTPSKILLVTGYPISLYYENFISDVKGFNVSVDCAIGTGYVNFWKVTPTTEGTFSMTIRVYKDAVVVSEKSLQVVVKAASQLLTEKNGVSIGDSLTEPVYTINAIISNFQKLGGVQPVFRGTKTGGKTEGRSGWTAENFATGGLVFYRFEFTGHTAPMTQWTSFTNNGSTFTVYEVNRTDGNGYVNMTRSAGTNLPDASGVLVSTSGLQSITYTSYSVGSGNPLWDGTKLNVANYRTVVLGMPENVKFDIVNMQLGINDIGQSPNAVLSDAVIATKVSHQKAIVDAFIADNPTGRIIVQLEPSCNNTAGGFPKLSHYFYYRQNMFKLWKALLNQFDNAVYNPNVYVGISGLAIHPFEGYPQGTVKASDRYTSATPVNTNSVHPRAEGYQEIGDHVFHQILHLLV